MLLRAGLWISVVAIPIVIVLGAAVAFTEYGWITLPIVGIVAYELLVTLHENLAELGLDRIARRFPARIRNARS
jgi:hypothetical protein